MALEALTEIERTYEEIRACVLRHDPHGTFVVEVRTLTTASPDRLHMVWDATFLGERYVHAIAIVPQIDDVRGMAWNYENLCLMLKHALWSLLTIASTRPKTR